MTSWWPLPITPNTSVAWIVFRCIIYDRDTVRKRRNLAACCRVQDTDDRRNRFGYVTWREVPRSLFICVFALYVDSLSLAGNLIASVYVLFRFFVTASYYLRRREKEGQTDTDRQTESVWNLSPVLSGLSFCLPSCLSNCLPVFVKEERKLLERVRACLCSCPYSYDARKIL